jgi:hypothetical protein
MESHEPRPCWICGREVDAPSDLTHLLVDIRSPWGHVDEALPLVAHGWCIIITTDSSQRGALEDWFVRNHGSAPEMT